MKNLVFLLIFLSLNLVFFSGCSKKNDNFDLPKQAIIKAIKG